MAMRNSLRQWSGILVVLMLILAFGIEAREPRIQSGKASEERSDVIIIDTMSSFGALDRPAVVFSEDV